jgi:hypothetical protein
MTLLMGIMMLPLDIETAGQTKNTAGENMMHLLAPMTLTATYFRILGHCLLLVKILKNL